MSSDVAIRVSDVSKHYMMFERPEDRLKQMIVPRLQRLAGRTPRRYFQDFAALNGISFEIGRGETVGIIGRNGCGKSTLLQIVCGTLQPSTGTVDVNGRIAALLELGAGFNPEFTGRENVYLNAAILGLSRTETDARFDEIARFADIGIFLDQPVKTYSSGMYIRLAFAVATNVDPDILVVDEALAVGDEAFQRKCFARIEDIKDKGGTILFVSHSAQTIVQLCDRAMLFDRGEKILEGRPKTVVGQYQRFVNLSGNEAETVREKIKSMDGWAGSALTNSPSRYERGETGSSTDTIAALPENDTNEESWFDPTLQSTSSVVYENQGAEITDVRLSTLSGRNINVVKSRRKYRLNYNATFTMEARNVAFGFTISTLSGLGIGGAGTSQNKTDQIPLVNANTMISVGFDFECLLNPGVYFITAGVSGEVGGNRKYLHRIVESIPFRVIDSDERIATGYLNLAPVATFSIRHSLIQGAPESDK